MNFLDAVMDYMDNQIDLGKNETQDVFATMPHLGEENSVAVRLIPSAPIDYIAGFIYEVGFQVLVKNKNQIKAITVATDIFTDLHHGQAQIAGEGFRCISVACTTLPNWVETTEDGYHIYTALFKAEIEF